MITVGLTGATGAGKSIFGLVASEEFGACHIDTDRTARKVVLPGSACLDGIVSRFGKTVLLPDGSLDRATLGRTVFADPEKISALNALTHPYITAEIRKVLAGAKADGVPLAVVDAPVLFESGFDREVDVTLAVLASPAVRLERIMARDGISRADAERRMAVAHDAPYFIGHCDCVLYNDASLDGFKDVCRRFIRFLLTDSRKGAPYA